MMRNTWSYWGNPVTAWLALPTVVARSGRLADPQPPAESAMLTPVMPTARRTLLQDILRMRPTLLLRRDPRPRTARQARHHRNEIAPGHGLVGFKTASGAYHS